MPGVRPGLVSVALMLGSSAAFVSPFGYQCNLMVYGAGNYRTIEFVKFGTGFKVWLWAVSTALFALDDHQGLVCCVSVALALATIAGPFLWCTTKAAFLRKEVSWL
ncbi:hypothetical protein DUNSADRAFT_15362 [Dunaliella salina]|uniref:Uncharacterized protein n=1 Tax=Dunaliella salina TaxID=3046 RepID=A0ABQ7H1T0_DUNSA|nr:hypothetical protein DUNSADRAFT_15362 [Dunaliella salina]|eukprot:KAF5840820.1 hypothetical protein DUNSADRAFT_15362 [Dunaliella salina]